MSGGKTLLNSSTRVPDSLIRKLIVLSFHSPDRWKSPSETALETPGIWGNQMTFMGGSRGCIGFQFAVYE